MAPNPDYSGTIPHQRRVWSLIQPHRLDDVLRKLDPREIHLKTVTNVFGCGSGETGRVAIG